MGMINLLPEDLKKELKSAHFNVILIRYLAFLGFAIAFLVVLSGASYWFLNSIKDNNSQLQSDQISTKTVYASSKKQLDSIISSLTTAKTILDQQVSYSTIITKLAQAMPNGIVLDSFKLSIQDINKPLTLKAHAISEEKVADLRNNLLQSEIFSSSSAQSIRDNQDVNYPVSVVINLTINKVNLQ